MAIVTRRCSHCHAHGCYRDEDGTWRCLLCARKVDAEEGGKRHLETTPYYMQTPPGAFVSLRAQVPVYSDTDGL